MKRTKVATIVGTRPEIIRLSCVMPRLDRAIDHVIVHTGQNYDYELNSVFFEDLELRSPDYFLEAAAENPAATIGRIIERVDRVLADVEPDALLVLGDTNSCLSAIPAKRRHIPVFHMEAGNRCFDERVPEETNRKIVDHIADINLTYSSIAREYLLREGIPPDRVIWTGSPMFEVTRRYAQKIAASDILERLGVRPGQYFVVSCHREENVDSAQNLQRILEILRALAAEYGEPIIMSTHPRTRKRLQEHHAELPALVRVLKPLAFSEYVRLQKDSRLVLSDSGTITEESSILQFPALNIREAHERPEGMEEAAVMMSGLQCENVLEMARIAQTPLTAGSQSRVVQDYQVPNVSEKVVRIILSYVDYVNRNVWKKQAAIP